MQLTMFKHSHAHTQQNKHKLVAKNNNHNKQNKYTNIKKQKLCMVYQ